MCCNGQDGLNLSCLRYTMNLVSKMVVTLRGSNVVLRLPCENLTEFNSTGLDNTGLPKDILGTRRNRRGQAVTT